MDQASPTSWSAKLPDRKLKLFVVGIGLGYWCLWGLAALLLAEGHPYADNPACAAIDPALLFWTCDLGGMADALGATLTNATLLVTLTVPLFVIAAQADPAVMPLATLGLAFNAIGLPAGLFVFVRSVRRLLQHLAR
ncbi:MAG: hypothetical protein KI785_04670 [Devosiaceae bacterium]|nr:hypothetical protein [Devosiaceae bacterium MH13]